MPITEGCNFEDCLCLLLMSTNYICCHTREKLFKTLLLEQMTVRKRHLNSYRKSSDFGKISLPYFSARVKVC